jgi:hypothetical protein
VESFERWSTWAGVLDAITHAPFAPNGAFEAFDAWPLPLFALEMTPGLVAGTALEPFDGAWWTGAMAFAWGGVAKVGGLFGVAAQELFSDWRLGEVYAFAFAPTALAQAAFKGGSLELFDGATWTTKNTTLG